VTLLHGKPSASRASPDVDRSQPLAEHIEESLEVVASFRMDGPTSRLQRLIDRTTDLIAQPILVAVLLVAIALWIGGNLLAKDHALDASPFSLLELVATLAGLMVALLILVTQRREDRLAERRAQLTLELALLADKKSAKIIALLEEMRRDHPELADRVDRESEDMAKPADPNSVLAAIDRAPISDSP
jgi:uncharacterized membrane protein